MNCKGRPNVRAARRLTGGNAQPQNKQNKNSQHMKINRILALCGVAAAVFVSAHNLAAQDNNNADQGAQPGGGRRNRGGQNGGGQNGGPGGGNFDPAQFQQRMMQRTRDNLGFTNDSDWSAVEPLVQKVMDARREVGFGGRGGFGGGRNNRGGQGGQGGQNGGGNNPFNQPNPDRDALQKAVDDNAPSAQIKDLLAKYEASQKTKRAKLASAQGDLRKVLTVKQEAAATLAGLLE